MENSRDEFQNKIDEVQNFLNRSVEAGLVTFDEATEDYKVAKHRIIQDFVEKLNLSKEYVQSMFDEIHMLVECFETSIGEEYL